MSETRDDGPSHKVEVTLDVLASDRRIEVELHFRNTGARTVHLLREKICEDGRLESPVFRIETEAGDEVPYAGRLAKRPPPGPGDWKELGAGESLVTRVEIHEVYRFPPGKHRYTIRYHAIHAQPNGGGLVKLTTATKTFAAER